MPVLYIPLLSYSHCNIWEAHCPVPCTVGLSQAIHDLAIYTYQDVEMSAEVISTHPHMERFFC